VWYGRLVGKKLVGGYRDFPVSRPVEQDSLIEKQKKFCYQHFKKQTWDPVQGTLLLRFAISAS
jgi:hypothetical protein